MKAAGSIALVVVAVAFGASPVRSADIKPAIVFDIGGKFDKSFNEGVSNGAEKFKEETKIAVADFEPSNETQFEQAHRAICPARRRIRSSRSASPRRWRWRRSPRNFPTSISPSSTAWSKLPNVQSVVFKEQEGSFLVGMLAAMASKTGKVGFVGGMDIPLIRKLRVRLRAGHQIRQSEGRADRRT